MAERFRGMRRGSLASALTSIENLQKKVPSLARALSHHTSRDRISTTSSTESEAEHWVDYNNPLPHVGFIKDPSWRSVQGAIISIFEQKPLSVLERTMLCANMRKIGKSELGAHVHSFYRTHLVRRAMHILLKQINTAEEGSLQDNVLNTWDTFYTEILPLLQSVFFDISTQLQCSNIRDVTLLAFRDYVLFQVSSDALLQTTNSKTIPTSDDEHTSDYPPALVQMLLILQHVYDPEGYTEERDRLEKLIGQVVNPYLGNRGLYMGSQEPAINTETSVKMVKKNTGNALSLADNNHNHTHHHPTYPYLHSYVTSASPLRSVKVNPSIGRLIKEESTPPNSSKSPWQQQKQQLKDAGLRRERCHTLTESTCDSLEEIPVPLHNKGRRYSVQFNLS